MALSFGVFADTSARAQIAEHWRLDLTNAAVRDIASLPSGDLFLAHAETPPALDPTGLVTRISASGDRVWTTALPGGEFIANGRRLALDGAGNVYVAARSNASTLHWLIRLNSAGQVEWRKSHDTGNWRGTSLAVGPSGDVAWATAPINTPGHFQVSKFAPDGNRAWDADIPEVGAHDIVSLEGNSSGEYFLLGKGYSNTLTYVLAKVSPSGATLWTYRSTADWQGPGTLDQLTAAADGGAFVEAQNGIARFVATGELLWLSPGPMKVLRVEDDGSLYANELRNGVASLTKIGPNGAVLWRSPLPSHAFAMAEIDESDFILGMIRPGYWTDSFQFGAINPDGEQEWFATHAGPSQSFSGRHGMTAGMDGRWRLVASSAWPHTNTIVSAFGAAPLSGAPLITAHPESVTVIAGETAFFEIEASGTGPLSFRWYEGSGASMDYYVSGDGRTMAVPTSMGTRDAEYYVEVGNTLGSVRSRLFGVRIIHPPYPIYPPPPRNPVAVGGELTLSPAFEGTPPLAYQWYHNGIIIPGATNSSFHRSDIESTDAGKYQVTVSNAGGLTNSELIEVVVSNSLLELWRQRETEFCCGFECVQVVDASGSVYVARGDVLLKYSPDGTRPWSTNDPCRSAVSDLSGGIIYGSDSGISRRAADGLLLWHRTGPSLSLASLNGSVVSGNQDLKFFGLDGTPGDAVAPGCDGCGWQSIERIIPSGDGGLVFAGFVTVAPSNPEIGIARLNAAGQTVWSARPGLTQVWPDDYAIEIAPDGGVLLSGIETDVTSGLRRQITVKYDSAGRELWRRVLDGAWTGEGAHVATDAVGNVVVASKTLIAKYSSVGDELWWTRSGHPFYGVIAPKALHVDAEGQIYLVGADTHAEESFVLEELDPSGNSLWVTSLGSLPAQNALADLNVSSDGIIHVVVADWQEVIAAKFLEQSPTGSPPQIVVNPGPSYLPLTFGTNFSLTAVASGESPIGYQWWFMQSDGSGHPVMLAGETNATLVVTNTSRQHTGHYYVEACNRFGFVTTRPVIVEIGGGPFIVLSEDSYEFPASPWLTETWQIKRVNEGSSVHFSTDDYDLSSDYRVQWYLDGRAIPDATNAVLLVTNAAPSDAGVYSVTAANRFGTVTLRVRLIVEATVRATVVIEEPGPNLPVFQYGEAGRVDVAAASDGSVYLLGGVEGELKPDSWFLAKYAKDGTVLWRRTEMDLPDAEESLPVGMAVDRADNVVVLATTATGKILLRKLARDGAMLWATNQASVDGRARRVDSICSGAEDSVFVSAIDRTWQEPGVLVAKFSSVGALAWLNIQPISIEYTGAPTPEIGIAAMADGGACVASRDGLRRLSATGEELWHRGTNYEAVAVDESDNIYATGRGTAKYSASGARLWSLPNFGMIVRCDSQGVVIASSYAPTERISAEGAIAWSSYGRANAIALGPAGETYVTRVNTHRLDGSGAEVWQSGQAVAHFYPYTSAIAVCRDGDVVVAQSLTDGSRVRYVLMRYDQSSSYPPTPFTIASPPGPVRAGEQVCLSATFDGNAPFLWFQDNWPLPTATNLTLCITLDQHREGLYRLAALTPEGVVFSRAVPVRVQRPFLYPPQQDNIGRWYITVLPPRYGLSRLEDSQDLLNWKDAWPGFRLGSYSGVTLQLPANTNAIRFFRLIEVTDP